MATYFADKFPNIDTFDCNEGEAFPSRYGACNTSYAHKRGTHALASKYLVYSDYSGNLVERSNVAEWRERFADSEDIGWVEVSGGYATSAIVINLAWADSYPDNEVAEFISALEDYPLANEDRHSQMEVDVQQESWEHSYREDFRKALNVETSEREDYIEALTDEQLFTLFSEGKEKANVYWENQNADEMYIDLDRIVTALLKVNPTLEPNDL